MKSASNHASASGSRTSGIHARRHERRGDRRSALRLAVLATPAVAALALAAAPTRAANYYFDADGQGAQDSASGQWDQAQARWTSTPGGTSYVPWPGNDDAFFTGSGTTEITGAINATGIHVAGNRYFNNGVGPSGPGSLTLSTSLFDVTSGNAHFLSAVAASGLTKTGAGALSFYAGSAGVPTGSWDIQQGAVVIRTDNTGLTGRAVNVAAGATLDYGHANIQMGALSGAGDVILGTLGQRQNLTGSRIRLNTDGTSSVFSGVLSGVGRLEKLGTGSLTLSGANTIAADMTVRGTLVLNGGSALSDVHPLFIQGSAPAGTVVLGANEAVGSLGGNSNAQAGTLDVGGFTFTVGGDNGPNQFAGTVLGSGLIRKVGSGVQIFHSAGGATTSTYSGKWEVNSGILGVAPSTGGADLGLGPVPGAETLDYIKINNGGTFAGMLSTAGSATQNLAANRGITVVGNAGLGIYSSTMNSVLSVNGKVTGSADITKVGGSILHLNADNGATLSSNWSVPDGALGTSSATAATPFGTGSITLGSASLRFVPSGSGASPIYNLGALTYTGVGHLQIFRNTNTGATINLASLTAGADGSLLIHANDGPSNLGVTERILVGGSGAATVNGIIPRVLLTSGGITTAATVGDFVGNGVNGLERTTAYTTADLNTLPVTAIYQHNAGAPNLAGAGAVYALKVGDGATGATLDLGGNTLTVGGGADPAMVIVNADSAITNGTISFGGRDAILYAQVPNAPVSTTAALSGALDVTKTGTGVLQIATPMSYSGKTFIGAGAIQLAANEILPSTTDVVLSGASAAGDHHGRLALNGFTQTVNSLSGSAGGDLDLGANGVLKIVGNANTTFLGGSTAAAGSGTSTLWNAGGGKLQLGPTVAIASGGGVGLSGRSLSYNRLKITDGSTVAMSSTAYITNNPASIDPLAYELDGGTLQIDSYNQPIISANGNSTFNLSNNSNRGMTIGAAGGTLNVTNPAETVNFFRATNFLAASAADLLRGTGTFTKAGPGTFRVGIGNSFAGKWNITGGLVIFGTDGNGFASHPVVDSVGQPASGLGAAPTSFLPDGITLNGGGMYSDGDGVIHPNRGITVAAGGGTFWIGGEFILNGKVTGPGSVTITRTDAASGVGKNVSFNGDNNTHANTLLTSGYMMLNGEESGGTGTITLDPSKEQVGIGKNEGDSNTVSTPIVMGAGGIIDIRAASDGSPVLGSVYFGQATGTLTLAGKISGPGHFFKGFTALENDYAPPPALTPFVTRSLDGAVILSNSTSDFTGNVMISNGALIVAADNALGSTAGHTSVNNFGTLGFQGGINYTAAETVYISGAGPGAAPGAVRNVAGNNTFGGTILLTSDAQIEVAAGSLKTGGIRGAANLTKGGGDLEAQHVRTNGLTLNTGNLKITPSSLAAGVSNIRTINVNGNKIDLTDNKLITADAAGTWDGASAYNGVAGLVDSARGNAGNAQWDGTSGITTSDARAFNNGDLVSIGVVDASDKFRTGGGAPIGEGDTAVFGGQTVFGSDTLVMATWGGDANLDGKINIDDYGQIDSNVSKSGTVFGWNVGDFNYDGKINIDDYGIIDGNIGRQTGTFFTAGGGSGEAALEGVAAVPEPAGLSMVVLGAAALAGRRRRHRRSTACENH